MFLSWSKFSFFFFGMVFGIMDEDNWSGDSRLINHCTMHGKLYSRVTNFSETGRLYRSVSHGLQGRLDWANGPSYSNRPLFVIPRVTDREGASSDIFPRPVFNFRFICLVLSSRTHSTLIGQHIKHCFNISIFDCLFSKSNCFLQPKWPVY